MNGAQTTGSIGNLAERPDDELRIPIRFFKTDDEDMVLQIIRYNNSQNKVEASDFRSTDKVQRRLKGEFAQIDGYDYEGGRRGGVTNAIKRRPNLVPSYTIGQALTAFHGSPLRAYNEKSAIWSDNSAYQNVFHDGLTAEHMIFVFTLFQKIADIKASLRGKSDEELTDKQKAIAHLLAKKGSHFYLLYVVSRCMGSILDRPVPSKFDLRFKSQSGQKAESWAGVLEVILSFSPTMSSPLEAGIKGAGASIPSSGEQVRQLIDATRSSNQKTFERFAKKVAVEN